MKAFNGLKSLGVITVIVMGSAGWFIAGFGAGHWVQGLDDHLFTHEGAGREVGSRICQFIKQGSVPTYDGNIPFDKGDAVRHINEYIKLVYTDSNSYNPGSTELSWFAKGVRIGLKNAKCESIY